MAEHSEQPLQIAVKFREGSCLMRAEIFSTYEVPSRVFTGMSDLASSLGSCCASSSDREGDVHVSEGLSNDLDRAS